MDFVKENGVWVARDVPIIGAGIEYPSMLGPITFTAEQLTDAVQAYGDDPAVVAPRVKLGHTSEYNDLLIGDAEPAFGRVENLKMGDNGQTVYGDYVGVPEWLGSVMPVAYPNRSIEGNFDVQTVTGKQWKLVIFNVSLLGVRWPGCSVLEDLPLYYGSEIPEGVEYDNAEALTSEGAMRLRRREDTPDVMNAVDVAQVRRKFYNAATSGGLDTESDTYWWWIRGEKYDNKEGLYLIVDDEKEGNLYKVPAKVTDNDIEFGTPVEVTEEFPVKTAAERAALVVGMAAFSRDRGEEFAVYASRADTSPEDITTQEDSMDEETRQKLASQLGLPEDATPADVQSKLVENALAEPAADDGRTKESGQQGAAPTAPAADEFGTTGAKPETPLPYPPVAAGPAALAPDDDPEALLANGRVAVDKDVWEQTKRGAQLALDNDKKTKEKAGTDALMAAQAEGRFLPSRRGAYELALERDYEGTMTLLTAPPEQGGLVPGVVPLEARGTAGSTDPTLMAGTVEGLPDAWFPEIAEAKMRNAAPVMQAKEA